MILILGAHVSRSTLKKVAASFTATALALSACGDGGTETTDAAQEDRPTVVVTTNILGDVVENLVGDSMNVVTIMPAGTDPHDFQASAQQVAQIGEADVLIVNGESYEEGLLDVIEGAESDGVSIYEATSAIETIEFGEGGHDDHGDDDHKDEDHDDDEEHGDEDHDDDEEHGDDDHDDHDDDEHGHNHEGADPHFFTDPARMVLAAEGIIEFLATNVEGVDADALNESASAYIAELEALDAEVEQQLSSISDDRRVLITNHEVFGYFADRYDFEVAGAVIPSGSTSDSADAEALTELAELIEAEGVPAIFADTSASDELVSTLAAEVGDIEVIALFSESLGDADTDGSTYVDMVRTNAERITAALGA